MERRPPIHWLMLTLLLGIEVVASCGFGLAQGLALANMAWKPTGHGEELRLAFTSPMHPLVGGGYLLALVFAIPATWKHGVPWVAAGVAAIGGFLLGLLVPSTLSFGGLPVPWVVAAVAGALP